MNSFLMAFGLASITLCIGTFLRAKVPFLRNMLVPASVIAGIIGLVVMNAASALKLDLGTDGNMYTEIVNHLFTISFISISLTGSGDKGNGTAKNIFKGALGMGMVWNLLYALTPLLGIILIALIGGAFDTEKGLTDFGKKAVSKFLELGIIPDISHSSEQTAKEIARALSMSAEAVQKRSLRARGRLRTMLEKGEWQ